MTSRELFKRFASLCQKWPKDETKAGRDFGENFRQQLGQHFPHGESSQIKDPEMVDTHLGALERLANNNYYNENVLKRSSASGMESWTCREIISNEGMKVFEDGDETTLIKRLKQALSMRYTDIDDKGENKSQSNDLESSQTTQKRID